jgi:hypothetical protein
MIEEGINDITDREYHADTAWLTSSMLKTAAEDMALFKHKYLMKHSVTRSAAMELGSVIHHMLAGQDDAYAVWEGSIRRGKAYDEFRANFADDHLIVTKDVADNAALAVEAVRSNRWHEMLNAHDTIRERCFAWRDGSSICCKFKPDVYIPDLKIVVDYKTVSQFSQHKIQRQFSELRYHLQAAHYAVGASMMEGDTSVADVSVVFVYVETQAPYRTTVIKLSDADMEQSLDLREKVIANIRACADVDDYQTEFSRGVNIITLPEYAYNVGY